MAVLPVGYQIYLTPGRYEGPRGLAYTYITAGNGLWLEAENDHIHIRARVLLAAAEVRGLAPLTEEFTLLHGRLPLDLWWRMCGVAGDISLPQQERFMTVRWRDRYHLELPPQKATPASVRYASVPDAVLEVHTHPGMGAFFSGTDDQDEQGFRLYGVLGWDAGRPAVRLRLGIYVYFVDVAWCEVFQGDIGGWHDMVAQELREGG